MFLRILRGIVFGRPALDIQLIHATSDIAEKRACAEQLAVDAVLRVIGRQSHYAADLVSKPAVDRYAEPAMTAAFAALDDAQSRPVLPASAPGTATSGSTSGAAQQQQQQQQYFARLGHESFLSDLVASLPLTIVHDLPQFGFRCQAPYWSIIRAACCLDWHPDTTLVGTATRDRVALAGTKAGDVAGAGRRSGGKTGTGTENEGGGEVAPTSPNVIDANGSSQLLHQGSESPQQRQRGVHLTMVKGKNLSRYLLLIVLLIFTSHLLLCTLGLSVFLFSTLPGLQGLWILRFGPSSAPDRGPSRDKSGSMRLATDIIQKEIKAIVSTSVASLVGESVIPKAVLLSSSSSPPQTFLMSLPTVTSQTVAAVSDVAGTQISSLAVARAEAKDSSQTSIGVQSQQ